MDSFSNKDCKCNYKTITIIMAVIQIVYVTVSNNYYDVDSSNEDV